MKHFKKKNFFWTVFWFALAAGGRYGRAPMLDWAEVPEGYWYNVLGFSPLILMGVFNYFKISDKPLKRDGQLAFYIAFFAFFYFLLLIAAVAHRAFLIPVFAIPLGLFMGNTLKYLRGFFPK